MNLLSRVAKQPRFGVRAFSSATIGTFDVNVKGQSGKVGQMMIGSSCFGEEEYSNNVIKSALELGVRHIDTALLYGNQMYNKAGIQAAGLKREDVMITSKVGYFPPGCEGKIYPWNDNNVKLGEADSIDLCLK